MNHCNQMKKKEKPRATRIVVGLQASPVA